MKKYILILALLALSFSACKETDPVKPVVQSAQPSLVNSEWYVHVSNHSGKGDQLTYTYQKGEGIVTGTVQPGERLAILVLHNTTITLQAEGATYYQDGEKLDNGTFTVERSCGITAVF